MENIKTATINVFDITPFEHFLAKDVYTDLGVLIAKKGSLITKKILGKLKIYNIETVKVIVKEKPKSEQFLQYNNHNIDTMKKFEENYYDTVDKIQSNFGDIVDGKPIKTDEIISASKNVINSLKYETDIFNYLFTIKDIDDVTFNHCLNVSIMCEIFAKWLNFSSKEIEELTTVGLLHDIGKTKVNQNLINKKGKLTPDEYEKIKKHVLYSYRIVEHQNLSKDVKLGILMHHERLDGSGYLTGAKGSQIHKYAKIVAIVDIYDAMTQKRPYHNKMVPLDVLEYLRNSSLTKLDYNYTKKFIDFASTSYKGCWVRLNTGEEGEIVYINPNNIHKPLIKIDNNVIDLSQEYDLCINEIF